MNPQQIETSSMAIIEQELDDRGLLSTIAPEHLAIVKRVIHTSADFDFATTLAFTSDAVSRGLEALQSGEVIVSDTNMILAGISKPATSHFGNKLVCYVADKTVAAEARDRNVTRSTVAMERALQAHPGAIFAIGNAPTALFALADAIEAGAPAPSLVIAVPVGFVNVVESKERIANLEIPSIVAHGRKGGSPIAVSIINAMLYQLYDRSAQQAAK